MAVTVVPLEFKTKDERRTIHEAMIGGRRLTVLTIKGAVPPLGNHYHPLPELFLFVSGTAKLLTCKMGGLLPIEPVQEQMIKGPCQLEIPAETAHTFLFEGPAVLVSENEGEFKQEDLVRHELA